MTTQTTEPQTAQTADETKDAQQVDIADAGDQKHKERVFLYIDPSGKEHVWADPGPGYTKEEVKRYLAKEYFSALRRAEMEVEDLDDGRQLVKFIKRAGKKGADSPTSGDSETEQRVFIVHYAPEEYHYDDPGPEYDNRAVFDYLQQWFVNLNWGQTEIVVGDGVQEVHFHTAPGTKLIGTSKEWAEYDAIDIADIS